MHETGLIFGIMGLPPESARNCVQELFPIPNGEFRRSVNGKLMFLETSERKKYRSIISCKDVNSPIVDSLWIGSQITIGCIQNLWQLIKPGTTSVRLIRPAVEGSISALNNFGETIPFQIRNNNEVLINKEYSEKIFVCFRPWLTMYVTDFQMETNEWNMSGSWKVTLEEA